MLSRLSLNRIDNIMDNMQVRAESDQRSAEFIAGILGISPKNSDPSSLTIEMNGEQNAVAIDARHDSNRRLEADGASVELSELPFESPNVQAAIAGELDRIKSKPSKRTRSRQISMHEVDREQRRAKTPA